MSWETLDDFHRDMWMFSEIDSNQNINLEPPRTIIDWRNKMESNQKKSIFDDDNEQSEPGIKYFVSGRGRGGKNIEITPGSSTPVDLSDDEEIKKKIRQVSGLGYSNEVIMEGLNLNKSNNNHTSPCKETEINGESKNDKPPPLSVMLKKGKEEHFKRKNKTGVDINCVNEFPPL